MHVSLTNWFIPFALVSAAALIVLLLWKLPVWQVSQVRGLNSKERFDRVSEARKTLATIIGGIVVLIGGYCTPSSLRVAQENLRISEEGRLTELSIADKYLI